MYLRVTIKPNINAREITEKMKNSKRKNPESRQVPYCEKRHAVEMKTINFFSPAPPPPASQEPNPTKQNETAQ